MGKRGRKKSGISLENPSTAEETVTHSMTMQDGVHVDMNTIAGSPSDDSSTAEDQLINNVTSSEGADMNYSQGEDDSEATANGASSTIDSTFDMVYESIDRGISVSDMDISSTNSTNARGRKIVDWDKEDAGTFMHSRGYDYTLRSCKISSAAPTQIIIYTKHTEAGFTHKYEFESRYDVKHTYRCIEDKCPLCCAGIARYPRIYHPVYNILAHKMEVLQYMQFNDTGSLYPQIKSIFKRGYFPIALTIHASDDFKYSVDSRVVPDTLRDCGLAEYEGFMKHLIAHGILLENIHHSIDDELLRDSKIRRGLEFNGYDPDSFIQPIVLGKDDPTLRCHIE